MFNMSNREIRFENRFTNKGKRSRHDWKANRKDRKQYAFDGTVRVRYYDEFARCECYAYIPQTATAGFWKRETEFMTETDL